MGYSLKTKELQGNLKLFSKLKLLVIMLLLLIDTSIWIYIFIYGMMGLREGCPKICQYGILIILN